MLTPEPRYLRLKRYIVDGIVDGTWAAHQRLPSEGDLTRSFGVSRMTVSRALRELVHEGLIVREQGRGSFVAPPKAEATMIAVKGIREEIQARGAVHEARLIELEEIPASAEQAERFDLTQGELLFHSRLLHLADGVALQLEDRLVNPRVAPEYMQQDLVRITPHTYLMQVAPLERAEHLVEAELPDAATARYLAMRPAAPLLILTRRTWSAGRVASVARLAHPASRYRLHGEFDAKGRVLGR